jgi:hypothetical protein
MNEVAWLIECNLPGVGRAEWFTAGPIRSGKVEFSPGADKAVRFSRRTDAQVVLDWLAVNEQLLISHCNYFEVYSVTEHMWICGIE